MPFLLYIELEQRNHRCHMLEPKLNPSLWNCSASKTLQKKKKKDVMFKLLRTEVQIFVCINPYKPVLEILIWAIYIFMSFRSQCTVIVPETHPNQSTPDGDLRIFARKYIHLKAYNYLCLEHICRNWLYILDHILIQGRSHLALQLYHILHLELKTICCLN